MKTAEDILFNHISKDVCAGFETGIVGVITDAMKEYAIEVAKETQRNIADSADNDSIGKYIKMLALSESNLPNLNK